MGRGRPAGNPRSFSGSVLSIALVLSGLVAAPANAQSPAPTSLQQGDRVVMQVKNEPALSGEFTVTPEGTILLPLIGLVQVSSRPFADFEAEVRAAFARELADPEMVLTPFRRISILGEVRVPGYHWIEPAGTVADALVLSGGLLPSAKRKRILLVRGGDEMVVNLEADGESAATLWSGDRLVIERRSWFSENLAIFVGAAASVAAAAATSLIVR